MWITWWIVTFMGNLFRQKKTGNTRIFKNLSNGVEMYYVNLFSTKKIHMFMQHIMLINMWIMWITLSLK